MDGKINSEGIRSSSLCMILVGMNNEELAISMWSEERRIIHGEARKAYTASMRIN